MTTIWLLKIDCAGGTDWTYYGVAYLDEDVAKLEAERLKEEWLGYKPTKVEGEEIDPRRVICDRIVYDLDVRAAKAIHRERAIKKLTDAEKEALGVK